jgi:hypothetical protein
MKLPLLPSETISCDRYSCRLSASSCVARQLLRDRYGNVPDETTYCGSGSCAPGAAVRVSIGDQTPELPPKARLVMLHVRKPAARPPPPPPARRKALEKLYGKLRVLEVVYGGKEAKVRCLCACGTEKVVKGSALRSGTTKSCGQGACRSGGWRGRKAA